MQAKTIQLVRVHDNQSEYVVFKAQHGSWMHVLDVYVP